MKQVKLLLMLAAICISYTTFAQSISAQVDSLVKSKNVVIEISKIMPQSGPMKVTTDGYTLEIANDTVNCYLPYYGEVRTAIMGSELAIDVQKEKTSIQTTKNKDGYTLKFNCHIEYSNERVEFTVKIFENGNVNINCNLTSRDFISYLGTITNIKE